MTDDAGLRRVLFTLCLTQITGWGVLYYAFPVLSTAIAADTGWSQPVLTGAFSAGLVTSAVVGIPVGRWLDRHGPRALMTAGSMLASLSLAGVAIAPSPAVFAAAWIAVGVAMSGVLYPPAFVALTRWYGTRSVGALTTLTLVGGLASTVFAPVTAALSTRLDWRTTYLVLAAGLAVVTVPAHVIGLRRPWPAMAATHWAESPSSTARGRPFIALTAALALATCASYAVIANLVPLMAERGISTGTAALALGAGGVGQVLGRLGYGQLVRRIDVVPRTVVVFTAVGLTTALLGIFTTVLALVTVAVLSGVSRGIKTLLQATAVTERWGATHYGRLSGVMSAPVTVASATSPWFGAALASLLGGYGPMFLVLGGVGLLAAVIGMATAVRPPHPQLATTTVSDDSMELMK